MNCSISLHIATTDGKVREIIVNSYDTIRSLAVSAGLTKQTNVRQIFMSKGQILAPDFTLAYHNIVSGDSITILEVRNGRHRRFSRTDRLIDLERLNDEALREKLRVSDVTHMHYNTSKLGHVVYSRLQRRLEAQDEDNDTRPQLKTRIPDAKLAKISAAPLPISARMYEDGETFPVLEAPLSPLGTHIPEKRNDSKKRDLSV